MFIARFIKARFEDFVWKEKKIIKPITVAR